MAQEHPTISKTETVQTAVDWLVEQLPLIQQEGLRDIIEAAKQMEKEQIVNAWDDGHETADVSDNDGTVYYNETYGNNQNK